MAASVTITEENWGTVRKIKFAWVSAADGTVTSAATGNLTTNAYSGEVLRLVTVPGAAALAPDDNYNVAVKDEDNTDVLMGGGATRDTANTEQVLASSLGCVANDKLYLTISGAGADNAGTAYVYIR